MHRLMQTQQMLVHHGVDDGQTHCAAQVPRKIEQAPIMPTGCFAFCHAILRAGAVWNDEATAFCI